MAITHLRPSSSIAAAFRLFCLPASFFIAVAAQDSTNGTQLTSLVNLFIGTETGANGGSGGNAFPGAAIPHAMVKVLKDCSFIMRSETHFSCISISKVGIDVDTVPRQAGYIDDDSPVTGACASPIRDVIAVDTTYEQVSR